MKWITTSVCIMITMFIVTTTVEGASVKTKKQITIPIPIPLPPIVPIPMPPVYPPPTTNNDDKSSLEKQPVKETYPPVINIPIPIPIPPIFPPVYPPPTTNDESSFKERLNEEIYSPPTTSEEKSSFEEPQTHDEEDKPQFEEVSMEEMERRTNFPETPKDENGLPEGSVLVDGDMLINKENLHLWESGDAVYDQTWGSFPMWRNPISIGIAGDIQRRSPRIYNWIIESINELMQKTCLKFNRIYNPINGPYMMVKLSGSCFATFGQQFPRENGVNLGIGCTNRRTPAHEIIHSLGRFHEQTRMDRDNYIRVNSQYISCPSEYQKRPSNTYGIPYDYYSVMHYSQRSCSRGGATMTFPAGVDVSRVGREAWLTDSDIANINRRYCQRG